MYYDATGIYNVPFGNNNIAQYGTYAAARIPQQLNANSEGNESTLADELLGGGAFMAAIQGGPKLIHPKNSYDAMKEADKIFNELLKNETFKKLPDTKKMEVYKNLFDTERLSSKITKVNETLRSSQETEKILKTLNETKSKYIEALKAGDNEAAAKYTAEMKTIIAKGKKQGFLARLHAKGGEKAYDAKTVSNFASEAGKTVQKEYAKTATAAKATESTGLAVKAKNALKSGGFKGMAVIEGIIETFTEVIPAFELGTDKGIRQIGKSAVTVSAGAAGWCVGAAAGGAVGAKAGALAGTAICPGVGTAVGAIIGLAGGIVGSWAARKAAKAVVGKSETEIAQEKGAQQIESNNLTQGQMTPAVSMPDPFNYNFTAAMPQFNYNLDSSMMTNPFATSNMDTSALDLLLNQPVDSLGSYA